MVDHASLPSCIDDDFNHATANERLVLERSRRALASRNTEEGYDIGRGSLTAVTVASRLVSTICGSSNALVVVDELVEDGLATVTSELAAEVSTSSGEHAVTKRDNAAMPSGKTPTCTRSRVREYMRRRVALRSFESDIEILFDIQNLGQGI